MLFSSPVFLFLFLPTSLLIYYLAPKKAKNLVLLFFSLAFYTWGEQELVFLILASAVVDYMSGLIIGAGKRKLGLWLSIVFNLSILIYFKYSSFAFSNATSFFNLFNLDFNDSLRFSEVILPLGISFYTFQTMSYTIDVYRGLIKPNKNFIDFAMYVTLFPQLVAGPIVRYKHLAVQIKNRVVTSDLFVKGIERFVIGLAKKMIIANNCAFIADGIFSMPMDEMSSLISWIGVLAYCLQIYFDFSGYSDMAIGLGNMFGFKFPENFNYPYIAKSISEFWKRWHITLSEWFKDYLYIPLGGNRKSLFRTYTNLLIVFFITGLWHGASWNFIVWGLFHGVFLILERAGLKKTLEKMPPLIAHVYTLFIIVVSWVLFRSENLTNAFDYLVVMFSSRIATNHEFLSFYFTNEVQMAFLIGILFSMPIYNRIEKITLRTYASSKMKFYYGVKYFGMTALFVVCCIYVVTGSYNPFIYFRF